MAPDRGIYKEEFGTRGACITRQLPRRAAVARPAGSAGYTTSPAA